MIKYDVKSQLYGIAEAGYIAGGACIGFGTARLVEGRNFGLEELIGGVLLAGTSIYYRHRSRVENSQNRNLEKTE